MNDPRIPIVDVSSFAFLDLSGQDYWRSWTPVYSFATATGLTVTGRYHVVGKQCFFQVKSTGTSLATIAGASYIELPLTARGIAGSGQMTDDTTNIAVGTGHIDVAVSRFYPPSQSASADEFTFSGWFEV